MYGKSIGIIISKQSGNVRNSIFGDYLKRGVELGFQVSFFYIDDLDINEQSGKGLIFENGCLAFSETLIIPSFIYNLGKNNSKNDKQTLYELSQLPNVYVLNEQNGIKEKHLFDVISSQKELANFLYEAEGEGEPCFIYGQKGEGLQWEINKVSEEKLSEELEREILSAGNKILKYIQFFFPGLDEIGMQFRITKQGFKLESTFSLLDKINEINSTNPALYHKLISWPFKRMMTKENSNTLEDPEEIFFQDEECLLRADSLIWTKIKSFNSDELIIKIPKKMGRELSFTPTTFQFGTKEEPCQYIFYDDPILLGYNSFEQPAEIFVSDSLIKNMHIPLDLVYQIQFVNKKAILGPTIGFLLGDKNLRYNLKYMEKFSDRFDAYNRFGGLTIAFSARSVDWVNQIAYGMVFDYEKKQWRYDTAPIPATIYRRNFHQNKQHINKLRKLTNDQLFNSYHFKKSDLFRLKMQPEISEYLPETFLYSQLENLIDFVFEKRKVIMKPVGLSRGRGIIILEIKGNTIIVHDYREKTAIQHEITYLEELETLLRSMGIVDEEYLYQTWIPLLKIDNRALDVRVVMQKYNKMKWFCSGIECRVAGENEALTNIARGGEAFELAEVAKKANYSFTSLHKKILDVCNRFCSLMDQQKEHYAEFGIDIALDQDGNPWILEANIYPSFKGFKQLNNQTYLKIRNQPLFYAVQIQGFRILEENEAGRKYSYSKTYYYGI